MNTLAFLPHFHSKAVFVPSSSSPAPALVKSIFFLKTFCLFMTASAWQSNDPLGYESASYFCDTLGISCAKKDILFSFPFVLSFASGFWTVLEK